MTWVAGEQERALEFFRLRALRMENRMRLEIAMTPPSMDPYLAAQACFAALVRDTLQRQQLPEEEFEDSDVHVNQNIW